MEYNTHKETVTKILHYLANYRIDREKSPILHRQALYLFSVMLYERLSLHGESPYADRLGALALFPQDVRKIRQQGLSWNEALFYLAEKEGIVPQAENAASIPAGWEEYIDRSICIFPISDEDGIFCYRDNGAVVFVAKTDIQEDIIIEEEYTEYGESFDPPFYFTASTHFVSPVYQMRCAVYAFRIAMSASGYPHIPHIRMRLVVGPGTTVINDDCWDDFRDELDIIYQKEKPAVITADKHEKPIEMLGNHWDNLTKYTRTIYHEIIQAPLPDSEIDASVISMWRKKLNLQTK